MNFLAEFLPDFMHFSKIETTNIILLLGLILFLGAVGGRIFQKLKIPQVVGYIVIGIIIGQSGFQILSREVIVALEPLSNVALSLIGFMIGGELKTQIIKKYGKQFVGILLFEAIVPFFVVGIIVTTVAFFITKDFTLALSLGLILGAISSATAPAATTDVLRENRTKGPLTTTILGIVAMDDAVALILYAIASSISSSLLGITGGSLGYQLLMVAYDVFGSIILGSIVGFVLGIFIKNVMTDEGRILAFSLGALLLSTGIAHFLNLDNILTAMSMGFFMVNFAPAKTRETFNLVDKFTPPIYVLFFVTVGAKLNVWNINVFVGVIALLYVLFRTIGKGIGARFGATITKAPETVKKYLPFCLLSQAGVAIGLSIAAGQDFSSTIGATIMLVITATTFIVQLLGPICVKYAVDKAGETGLDVREEDIMKNCLVRDVTVSGKSICHSDSQCLVDDTTLVIDILRNFSNTPHLNYGVRKNDGTFAGLITLEHLKESLLLSDFTDALMACDIMEPAENIIYPNMTLPLVFELFSSKDTDVFPIVDSEGVLLGIVEKHLVEHYLHGRVLELQQKIADLG